MYLLLLNGHLKAQKYVTQKWGFLDLQNPPDVRMGWICWKKTSQTPDFAGFQRLHHMWWKHPGNFPDQKVWLGQRINISVFLCLLSLLCLPLWLVLSAMHNPCKTRNDTRGTFQIYLHLRPGFFYPKLLGVVQIQWCFLFSYSKKLKNLGINTSIFFDSFRLDQTPQSSKWRFIRIPLLKIW